MKNKLVNKAFVLVATAMATSLLSAEDLVLSGDYPVTVSAGTSTTISDKVTGDGRIVLLGGGTLILDNSANDFTGGVIVSNGILRADASGAFGTGPISLEGFEQIRTVKFNAKKGVFPNDITLKDATSSETYPVLHAMQPAVISGNVAIDETLAEKGTGSSLYFVIEKFTENNYTAMLELQGECNAGKGSVFLAGGSDYGPYQANWQFKGKITAAKLDAGTTVNRKSDVYLYNSENEIKEIRLVSFNIHCAGENVFRDCSFWFYYNWAWGANRGQGKLYLNGNDQSVRYFSSKYAVGASKISVADNSSTAASDYYSGNRPATITFTGLPNASSYSVAYVRLMGNLSVVVDAFADAGETYQRFYYFENPMAGDLTVKSGTLELREGAAFPNVKSVNVFGGQFYMQTVTNALPQLAKVVLSGGKIRCDANCKAPISGGLADVYLSGDGKFQFGNGITNTVRKLFVNGEYMPAGIYTKSNFPAMESSHESAALVVLRGRAGAFLVVR